MIYVVAYGYGLAPVPSCLATAGTDTVVFTTDPGIRRRPETIPSPISSFEALSRKMSDPGDDSWLVSKVIAIEMLVVHKKSRKKKKRILKKKVVQGKRSSSS